MLHGETESFSTSVAVPKHHARVYGDGTDTNSGDDALQATWSVACVLRPVDHGQLSAGILRPAESTLRAVQVGQASDAGTIYMSLFTHLYNGRVS